MSIKGWFENKIKERKAKQDQKKMEAAVAKQYERHRVSRHDASKKGYPHKHGLGFVTRLVIKENGKKRTIYKHRPGYDRPTPPNNYRVVFFRKQRDPLYLAG